MRVVSGIQPTGELHLGNYLGAIRQFSSLADGSREAFFFAANLHALTRSHGGELLRTRTDELLLDLLALGLSPSRCALFRQSEVPEVLRLAWILASLTPTGLLLRAHAYKDRVGKGEAVNTALLTYPVLMAADVLALGAVWVPVGRDQQQHLEIARELAVRLNRRYGGNDQPVAQLPEAIVEGAAAWVPGIDGQKMSKSYANTIPLFAKEAVIRRQVMHVRTDSTAKEAPKPPGAPLLQLLTLLCEPQEAETHRQSWVHGGVGYAEYKARLLERFFELFGEARRRRQELARDPATLNRVVSEGAARARTVASVIVGRVEAAAGIVSPS